MHEVLLALVSTLQLLDSHHVPQHCLLDSNPFIQPNTYPLPHPYTSPPHETRPHSAPSNPGHDTYATLPPRAFDSLFCAGLEALPHTAWRASTWLVANPSLGTTIGSRLDAGVKVA